MGGLIAAFLGGFLVALFIGAASVTPIVEGAADKGVEEGRRQCLLEQQVCRHASAGQFDLCRELHDD